MISVTGPESAARRSIRDRQRPALDGRPPSPAASSPAARAIVFIAVASSAMLRHFSARRSFARASHGRTRTICSYSAALGLVLASRAVMHGQIAQRLCILRKAALHPPAHAIRLIDLKRLLQQAAQAAATSTASSFAGAAAAICFWK